MEPNDGGVGAIGEDGSSIAKRRGLRSICLFLIQVTIIASFKKKRPLNILVGG